MCESWGPPTGLQGSHVLRVIRFVRRGLEMYKEIDTADRLFPLPDLFSVGKKRDSGWFTPLLLLGRKRKDSTISSSGGFPRFRVGRILGLVRSAGGRTSHPSPQEVWSVLFPRRRVSAFLCYRPGDGGDRLRHRDFYSPEEVLVTVPV